MKALPQWIRSALLGAAFGLFIWFPFSGFSPSQGVTMMTVAGIILTILGGALLFVLINAVRTYKAFFIISGSTGLVFAGLIAQALLNPPEQCTWQSTHEEIESSGCIIGADIGTGFVIFFLIFIWIVLTAVLAILVSIRESRRRRQLDK